ncbi:carboxylesterase/lipase family protein [Paenibacillus sp. P96]|uniref:Carboxylic ester hydrolase n=1 Tax=Paenibacillus zeirhizosphaerae TaxID=2987519 RepID=A0ABT9FVZ2_9BACL|nr:carboxylesterase/lipase family protein [Paenibacillus sp. P96]MDP4098901.1 carboxylesterase/lipase family protein [Paenibacillus sp. P96]
MVSIRVSTKNGELQGTAADGTISWKGIPYAQPPVGNLRFRAPQPPQAWEGIRDASQFGPVCPQPGRSAEGIFGSRTGQPAPSEDCLYLNVWAPIADAPSYPVMVWIHGGAFVTGSGSMSLYDGATLARNGSVVVVTINYRLGPFGFLHLSPFGEELASNAGLLDQIAALRWVQDHIRAFGGDPDNVTIFGESAGAMSIAALLAMPAAKGLFRKAVLQSGASQALSPAHAEGIAAALLNELGADTSDRDRLFTLSTEDIAAAANRLYEKIGSAGVSMLFQPVVDGKWLPEEPLKAIEHGAAEGVAMMIGTNRDEGAYFVRGPEHLISAEAAAQAIHAMTGLSNAAELSGRYPVSIEGQAQLMTDLYFWRSAVQYASGQAGQGTVWMYRFDWCLPGHPFLGQAVHGAEIAFVFHNLQLMENLNIELTEEMERLARMMQEAWVSFARSGNPSTPELQWPGYEPKERATVIFDREITVVQDPDAEKRRLFITAVKN